MKRVEFQFDDESAVSLEKLREQGFDIVEIELVNPRTLAKTTLVLPGAPARMRCNICGAIAKYDGTPPKPGMWGHR